MKKSRRVKFEFDERSLMAIDEATRYWKGLPMTTPTPAAHDPIDALQALSLSLQTTLDTYGETGKRLTVAVDVAIVKIDLAVTALAAERERVTKLVEACEGLIEYQDNPLVFQLENADDHIGNIRAALAAMEAK